MTVTGDLLHHPLVTALSYTLLHLLWQGAVMGLALAGALRVLRHKPANIRYVVCCTALAALAACPFVTFALLTGGADTGHVSPAAAGVSTARMAGFAPGAVETLPLPAFTAWSRHILPEALLALLPVVWCIGVILMSLRLLGGWIGIYRLQNRSIRPITGELQERCVAIAQQMGITRAVELLESAVIETPCTFGWLRTVILLPASALSGLSPRALEALLAHELAHIRRYDYLVNLLQTTLETLLFYHPTTWWISRQIRLEREHCCDDLAVAVLGDAKGYARALAALESCRQAAPAPALGAADGELLARIRRVLGAPSSRSGSTSAGSAAAIVLMLFLATASVLSLPAAYRRGAAAAQNAKRIVRQTVVATVMNLLNVDRATAAKIAFSERDNDRKAAPQAIDITANAPRPTFARASDTAGARAGRTQEQLASIHIHGVPSHPLAALPGGSRQPKAPAGAHAVRYAHPVSLALEPPQPPAPIPAEAISASIHKAFAEANFQLKAAANIGRVYIDSRPTGADDAVVLTAGYNPDRADPDDHGAEGDVERDEASAVTAAQNDSAEAHDMLQALKEANHTMDEAMRTADEQVRKALASVPPYLREARHAVERAQQEIRQAQRYNRNALEMAKHSK